MTIMFLRNLEHVLNNDNITYLRDIVIVLENGNIILQS